MSIRLIPISEKKLQDCKTVERRLNLIVKIPWISVALIFVLIGEVLETLYGDNLIDHAAE